MERLAYFSLATDLITRLDMLGATSAQAATATTVWQGACYAVSILGAYVADAWLGRYWTIVAFSCIYLLGLVGVVLCTGVAALNSRVALMAALYVVALGTGGIKANVSTFGADQFDDGDPAEAAAKSRYFNAFYFTINIGALIASLVVVNVQTSVSWLVGYTIPAVAFATAFVVFVAGTPLYTHVAPRGSPFSRLGAVFVAAAAKWRVTPPSDPTLLFESDSGEDEEEEDGWTGPGSPLAAALAKRRAGSAGSSVRLEGGRGWRTVSAGSMGREPLPADAAAAARAGDDSAGAEGGAAPARTPFSTHGTEAGAVPDPEDALARHHDPPFRLPASLVRAALRAERRTSSAGGEAAWQRTAAGGWLGTPRPLSAGIVSLAASSHGGARTEPAPSRAGSYADAHSRVPGSAAITSAAAAAAAATAAASGVRRRARAAAAAFEAAADAGADADAYIPPPSRRLAHTTYAPWLDKAATPLALYYRAAAEAGVARPRPPGGAPLSCCGGGLGPEDVVAPLPTAAPAGGLKLSEATGMTRSGGAPPPLRPIRLPGGGGPSTSPPPRERHLCSVTQTEETKRMLSFLPLCLTTVIFQAVYAQMSSTFVLQGRFMDRIVGGQFDAGGVHTGGFTISSATLSAFNTIAVLVCVPLYDLVRQRERVPGGEGGCGLAARARSQPLNTPAHPPFWSLSLLPSGRRPARRPRPRPRPDLPPTHRRGPGRVRPHHGHRCQPGSLAPSRRGPGRPARQRLCPRAPLCPRRRERGVRLHWPHGDVLLRVPRLHALPGVRPAVADGGPRLLPVLGDCGGGRGGRQGLQRQRPGLAARHGRGLPGPAGPVLHAPNGHLGGQPGVLRVRRVLLPVQGPGGPVGAGGAGRAVRATGGGGRGGPGGRGGHQGGRRGRRGVSSRSPVGGEMLVRVEGGDDV